MALRASPFTKPTAGYRGQKAECKRLPITTTVKELCGVSTCDCPLYVTATDNEIKLGFELYRCLRVQCHFGVRYVSDACQMHV